MMITLKSKTATVKICSKGAQLTSFLSHDNIQYLWQGDEAYWPGQSPILFPIVGCLRDGRTFIDGKEYKMARHGFARDSKFDVLQLDDTVAVFTLKSNDSTKEKYPFDFIFSVTYTLADNTLTWKFKIKNTGTGVMPFALGGHPAFNCPIVEGESFEDYLVEFPLRETAKCPVVGMETGLIDFDNRYNMLEDTNQIQLKHSLFDNDALIFDSLKSKTCKILSKKSTKGVFMDFKDFDMLGIWSSPGESPFVCLEPWIGCATSPSEDDNFENKRGLIFLSPDEISEKSFSVEIF